MQSYLRWPLTFHTQSKKTSRDAPDIKTFFHGQLQAADGEEPKGEMTYHAGWRNNKRKTLASYQNEFK